MARTRIAIAKPDIVGLFEADPLRIYRRKDLAKILSEHRGFWRLTQSMTVEEFLKYLLDHTQLRKVLLPLPHRTETLYTWGEVSILRIATAVRRGAYLSHYTAMALHELTPQMPRTIHVNIEQRPQAPPSGPLVQERIDAAFRRPQRMTTNVAEYQGYRLVYTNGKNTGQLGVIDYDLPEGGSVRVTGLERTLIDIAVRPAYAGGVAEIIAAYEAAKGTVSVNRLAAYLAQMNYIYPYEQVIGFYLERAGYKGSLVGLFQKNQFEFDFYLTYAMKEVEYVPQWRLYVPKGL